MGEENKVFSALIKQWSQEKKAAAKGKTIKFLILTAAGKLLFPCALTRFPRI